jgi:hypothetical protein
MHDTERLRDNLEESISELTPATREVWEVLVERGERAARGEEYIADLPPEYDGLVRSEQAALMRVVNLSGDLHAASAAENEGMAALMRQAQGTIVRAQRLEPDADNLTLEGAVAVLRRHGLGSGISPELAEMVVEVPVKEPTEEEVDAVVEDILDSLSPLHQRVLHIRMKIREEDEIPAEILEEVLALSESEAEEYLEEFK